jgi:hypothetical protein
VTEPVFATDPATHSYYEARATEYDEWYTGAGRFAHAGWFVAARAAW